MSAGTTTAGGAPARLGDATHEAAKVHTFIPPSGLSEADYEAWRGQRMRGVPKGATPLLARFVAPGAPGSESG